MKIFMLWDMEGVSGLFTREHVWYWEDGVRPHIAEEGRQLLIADINAASEAALEAGVDELIITDTHGGGRNIRLDAMHKDPRITYCETAAVRTGDQRYWLRGMDETVDGFMLPGHHAKAGTPNAFLPHTWMGVWEDFRINGQSVGEIGIETCFAGHFGVPLVFVQGDEATRLEVENQFPDAVMATVKRAIDRDQCTGPDAETARRLTAQKIKEAVEKLRTQKIEPFKPALPMTLTIRYSSAEAAQKAIVDKPHIRRIDDVTIEGTVERQCDVVKWIINTGRPD